MSDRSFDNIYNDYARLVYWAARRVVQQNETAEDITQQVFERVYLNLDKVAALSEPQLKGWLYRVSTNLALDHTRKAKREIASDEPIAATIADTDPLPVDELLKKQRSDAVKRAIDKLDDTNRTIITLHYFADMTVNEISEETGISPGTIKSRLVRSRKLLEDFLRAEVADYED